MLGVLARSLDDRRPSGDIILPRTSAVFLVVRFLGEVARSSVFLLGVLLRALAGVVVRELELDAFLVDLGEVASTFTFEDLDSGVLLRVFSLDSLSTAH